MIGFGLTNSLYANHCICIYSPNLGYKSTNQNVVYYIFKKYATLFANYLKKKERETRLLAKSGNIYKIILGNFKDSKLSLWTPGVIRLRRSREALMRF